MGGNRIKDIGRIIRRRADLIIDRLHRRQVGQGGTVVTGACASQSPRRALRHRRVRGFMPEELASAGPESGKALCANAFTCDAIDKVYAGRDGHYDIHSSFAVVAR